MDIVTPIMPVRQRFYNCNNKQLLQENHNFKQESLDLKSIAFYAATGFFFDDTTYYQDIRLLPAASKIKVNEGNKIVSMEKYWDYYYNPLYENLNDTTEAFRGVFEQYILENTKGQKVILPLSGGIDSRTIAAAIPDAMENCNAYSYQFSGGINEIEFGRAIAKVKNIPFKEYVIPPGYLWENLKELSNITHLYNEFTHSRQMAVIEKLEGLGNLFVLGHGGELFKAETIDNQISFEQTVSHIIKSIAKPQGLELGQKLWQIWGLSGDFYTYIRDIISKSLVAISMDPPNMRLRVFYYRHITIRRSQVNINVFARKNDILLPFLHQAMLDLVCSTREDLLTDRQIQINYIKQKSPTLAEIPWQNYFPLNLYSYTHFNDRKRLPFRAIHLLKRAWKEKVLNKKLILRNWELQFLGKDNDKQLRHYLLNNSADNAFLPTMLLKEYYQKFRHESPLSYAHPVSMLLTLSFFEKQRSEIQQTDMAFSNSM